MKEKIDNNLAQIKFINNNIQLVIDDKNFIIQITTLNHPNQEDCESIYLTFNNKDDFLSLWYTLRDIDTSAWSEIIKISVKDGLLTGLFKNIGIKLCFSNFKNEFEIMIFGDCFSLKKKETISNLKLESKLEKQEIIDFTLCPICSSKMKLRTGPYGSFWGCSKFPTCKGKLKTKEVYAQIPKKSILDQTKQINLKSDKDNFKTLAEMILED